MASVNQEPSEDEIIATPDASADLLATNMGDYLHITVRDDGPGYLCAVDRAENVRRCERARLNLTGGAVLCQGWTLFSGAKARRQHLVGAKLASRCSVR